MFVASSVGCWDEGEAVVALLPQMIGHIQTAIGCGTLRRANGIAVQVMVGDPVCQGDVIETAADGRIGIRFIDGTAFNLSGGTRVTLNEFVCDSNGTSRSALFAVSKGTFGFIAGQVAKTGCLSVETPVGSIRSRAHTGGVGTLSLAALAFSIIKEVQAADSNVTFLDDDNIAYKDMAHGAFELVTKEPIPRHIIVEDPGATIILSPRGSSISVNQVTNSAARMAELQEAQQDVLANFARGPNGSSSLPVGNPLPVQPINFIQTDTINPQNQLPALESAVFIVPEIIIVRPTLAITSIAGQIGIAADNIINTSRANAGVEITGTTSGVEDGQVVTITIVDSSNHPVYSGTATVTNSAWLINLSPPVAKALADGFYTLTADVANAAGLSADASQAIRVDETPPTIAIDTIVSNNVVNANAASAGFAIAGATTDAESGQPVTIKIVDSSGQVVDTFTTTLANNTWSINVTSTEAKLLRDGTYTVTADVSDSAGNPAPEATQAIAVDETLPTVTWLPPAESGIEGTAIALGTITATVNSLPGHSNSVQSLVVSGIPVGAVLTDGANNFMATSGNTSIDVKSWNLSNLKITPPNDTNFILTITATDQDANTASTSELVTVVPLAPDLHPVAAQGNEDTAIALNLGVTVTSLQGVNGDASLNSLNTLVVSDIPVGATLSDGTGLPGHSFTAAADNTSFDVANWNLSSLKITPPAEFEGSFTLTIAATEHDSEGNISATVTATEVVTVAPVAEPPTASAPATLALNENATGAAVAGVNVGPLAEDNDDTVSATLTVSHGTLRVASLSGVTVSGDDSATLTLSGSAAAVNMLLAGLTYTPTVGYEGSDTLHLSVTSSDGSNTSPTAATASTAITVNPIAESPTASAPATLALNENATGAAVAGVNVGPLAEDNDDTVSATLTVSHGTLRVASLSGVTVSGDDSATLTLSGSAAAVNTLLAGLTYTPTVDYEGADTLHLSVTSSDGSNTFPTVATASTAITVNPIAESPTASAPPTLALNENAAGAAVAGVNVGPLAEDNDDTVSATLTVSHGTLRVASLSGVTVSGDDSATLTLSGSAAAVNTLLAGLTYTPTVDYEGSDTLHLSVTSSDGSNTYPTAATASTAITVNPVAEPPTASAPARATTAVNTAIDISGVVVGPAAEDADDTVIVLLTVAHGALAVSPVAGVTETVNGLGSLTVSGTASDVNTALASLVYTPITHFIGSDTLNVSVTSQDGSETYPTQATAATAIAVTLNSESLIVGGPGPTLDWNDPDNWSGGVVPTLSINATINAPSNYKVIITGTPDAQAASLTIPHGAASTDIIVNGTLQLAGDLNVSDSGKLENDGKLEEEVNATFIGPITNNGTIIADPNVYLHVTGTITGVGNVWIDSGSTIEFAPGSKLAPGTTDSQIVYFEQGAGKLIIDDWGKFAGVITGTDIGTHLTSADLIDLTQLPFVGGSMSASVSYNSGTNISTITFSDGNSANNVTLHLSGNYTGTTWTFTSVNGGAGTEVRDPPTDSGTVTVDSGATVEIAAASAQTIDFAYGSKDAAIISGAATGSVIGGVANATPGTPLATGKLADTDVDNALNTFTAVSSPTASDGGYGAFTMTAAGMWTYTLDNNNSVVDATKVGDTLTDTFTVHSADGTAQAVTIAIHGASDADPNDFDNQATGTHVISDPPFLFGTPGHDSIAGGGDQGQTIYGGAGDDTINGTGKSDVLYGGSGKDTIKGNDGDDTICAGSGSDTINGNNGNDTFIGGFAANLLAGGNGNDRFVYLSATDSHAGPFNTITDFRSGSDKIDLTALGALAFAVLALTSTSTSVPAHTIAWLYDGTSNETIVYVNPTDQTLSIGSSSLLEIHLQGISTVEPSDFVIEPATAPAAVASDPVNLDLAATAVTDGAVVATTSADATSNWTANDGALLADGNGTVPTTDVGNNFFADRGWFDSIGYDRFISFGEIQTHATEDANDNAVITPASGPSIAPHSVHLAGPMANNFTFSPAPVLDNVSAMTIGDGAAVPLNGAVSNINITASNAAVDSAEQQHAGNGELIPTNAGTINAAATHGHTIDTGSSVEHHSGGPEASGNHGLAVAGSIAHSGHPQSDGGSQTVSGEADGHGVAAMHGTGEHHSEASSISDMVFGPVAGRGHGLGDSFHFNSAISASDGPGVVNLADLDLTPGSASHHENAAAHGTPMISEEAQTIDASLPGHHSTHIAAPDHAHVPHDLVV